MKAVLYASIPAGLLTELRRIHADEVEKLGMRIPWNSWIAAILRDAVKERTNP